MVSKNYYSLMINKELWAVLANKKNKIMENTSLDRHADSFGKIWFKEQALQDNNFSYLLIARRDS